MKRRRRCSIGFAGYGVMVVSICLAFVWYATAAPVFAAQAAGQTSDTLSLRADQAPATDALPSSNAMGLVGDQPAGRSLSLMRSEVLQGNGTAGPYVLSRSGISRGSLILYQDGQPISPSDYVVDEAVGRVLFLHPISAAAELRATYRYSAAIGSQGSRNVGAGPLTLLSLSPQASLGLLYAGGGSSPDLPELRGAAGQFQGANFLFKGGHFASTPAANARPSYMQQRLAELSAVAGGTPVPGAGSQSGSGGGQATPLLLRFQAGALTTETGFWNVDNSFAAGDASSTQGLLAALGSAGAPTGDWNQVRGFQHFHNSLSTGLGGKLSLSQNYSVDKNRQAGSAGYGLSLLNKSNALSLGGDGDALRGSWGRTASQTSWQDANRQGSSAFADSLGLSQRFGQGTLSLQNKRWGVDSSFDLPSGGGMTSSAQSLAATLQGLGASPDWNKTRGFGHSETSVGLQGFAGLSFSQARTVDVNQQAGSQDSGLTWSNVAEALSLGKAGDAFQGSWTSRTSQAIRQDPNLPSTEVQLHNLGLSQRLGGQMSLSFQDKWWKVDPTLNLPDWGSAPASVQPLVADMQNAGAPANDWNQVRGLEHGERTIALRASPLLSLSRIYSLDRNQISGSPDFGLDRNTRRDVLSVASRNGAFQGTFGRTSGMQAWDDPSRSASRLNGTDICLAQNLGASGSLGFSQVTKKTDTNPPDGGLESLRVRTSNYSLTNLPLVRGIGLGVTGSLQMVEPSQGAATSNLSLQTTGPGIKLAQGLSLQANYQEARADNQGSASTLALSTSAVALTSALKVDSLQFIRSIDAHGTATGQTNLNWTTRLIGGVAVSGQFQAKDADGQGYSFNRTFDLTQKVSDTTSLVASFARQENGGQRVMGTKRLTLARNDPQNRLGYSVTYDEMPDPQAQAVIRPVLQGKAMLGNGKGASLTWEYVQRDQADNSRLISKQIHAVLPLPSGFMLQGDYAKNPYDPNNRDKIQSFTMNQCWTLVGPIGGKAKLSVAYTSAGNLQAFTEADTTDVSLTASPSRNATFAFGFRLLKNYAPGSNSSRQGFIANYTRELDENHYLRISATDEPQEVGFINGMARCTSPTDSRLYLEYGTSF